MNDSQKRTSWFAGEFVAPWVFVVLGLIATIFAVGAIFESIFSNTLVGGPTFATEATDQTITRITPIVLETAGVRVGWGAASALILLGIALLLFTAAQIGRRVPAEPLFSPEIRELMTNRWMLAMTMFIIGGVARLFLRNRIANELAIDVDDAEFNASQDFDLWLFNIPVTALVGIALVVGWVFNHGAVVQADAEHIV